MPVDSKSGKHIFSQGLIALGVATFFFGLTLAYYQKQVSGFKQYNQSVVEEKTQLLTKVIENDLAQRLMVLSHLKERWEFNPAGMTQAMWEREARSIDQDYPGFQAIEWVDTQDVIRWVVPLKGNEKVVNMQSAFEPKRRAALEKAKRERSYVLTNVITLKQGGAGFLCYMPIMQKIEDGPDRYQGFIMGVMNFDRWINALVSSHLIDAEIKLHQDQLTAYQTAGFDGMVKAVGESKFRHKELRFSIALKVPDDQGAAGLLRNQFIILWGGLSVSILCGFLTLFGLRLRTKNQVLEANNQVLARDQLYPLLAQKMATVIWRCDPEGQFIEPQEAWEAYTGQDWVKHYGFGWSEMICEVSRPELLAEWEKAVAEKRQYQSKGKVWSQQHQTYRHFIVNAEPIFDQEGQIIEWIGMNLDVDDFHASEAAAKEANRMLQAVLDAIPSRVFWKNRERIYLGCNSKFASDAGLSGPDEMIGKSDSDLPWGERVKRYEADDMAVMNHDRAKLNFEEPLVTESGETHWLRTSKIPLKDDDQAVVGFLGVYEDITDKKNNEIELERTKQRFQLALKGAQISDWVWDLESEVLAMSPFLFRMLKRPVPEGPITQTFMYDLVHPDDVQAFEQSLGHYLEDPKNDVSEYRHEQRFKRSDGSWCWLMTVAEVAEQNEEGSPSVLEGFFLDISSIKESQSEVRQVNRKYEMAVRGAQIGTWDWNLETRGCVYNHVLFDMLGREVIEGEVPFEDIQAMIHPDDFSQSINHATKCLKGEVREYRQEQRYKRADGSWCWLLAVGEVTERDENGEPTHMGGVHLNIDELKEAQSQIESINQRFEHAVVSAGYGIFDWEVPTGKIRYFDSWYTMMGYAADDYPNTYETWVNLVHPEDLAEAQAALQATLSGEKHRYEATYRMRGKDGEWAWIQAIGIVTDRDEQGKPLYMLGIQANVDLIKTSELRLQQANHILEQKQQELEQFVYAVSHDLKAPMLSCMVFVDELNEELRKGSLVNLEYPLDRIQKNILQMSDCIEDLLELSRIGRIKNEPTEFVLDELFEDILLNFEEIIQKRKIHVQLPEMKIIMLADRARTRQLFQNLFENAFKYGCLDDKTNSVEVICEQTDGLVKIGVKDCGPGIPEKYQKKVFELFQRLESDEKGTGVGLTIVKRIADLLDGEVIIDSKTGQGATFWLSFTADTLKVLD